MASKVRLGEQVQAGYAARLREPMPHGISNDTQAEIGDDLLAHTAHRFDIAKKLSRTTLRVDQPLCSNIHDDCSGSSQGDPH
jgi:hypothetical protein